MKNGTDMRVLIFGGAGYIGSHVTRRFLDAGLRVTVFDNLSTGLRANLPRDAAFVQGDILDRTALRRVFASPCDAVVHLAALKAAGESMRKPEAYAENNLCGTVNILNAMTEAGVKRMIFSSTSSVYGEPEYLPLDEKHPLNPVSFYGFTKLEIERLLAWYDRLRGLKFVSLRYFNAAGYDPDGRITGLERNPANLIPVVMETAAGIREKVAVFGDDYDTPDGTGVRDYVHVTDLSEGHLSALKYLRDQGRSLAVNLGTGKGYSVREVIRTARRVTGKTIPAEIVGRRAGDPSTIYAGGSLAGDLLGWSPRYPEMDRILETHWKAYLANAG